jgi:hypothetical protein
VRSSTRLKLPLPIAALAPLLIVGCGAGGPGPGLGSGYPTEQVRAIDLAPGSPALHVEIGPFGSPIGTVSGLQVTQYQSAPGGTSDVRFIDGAGTLATFTGTLIPGSYNTVAVFSQSGGYGTFSLADTGAPTGPGTSQFRIANAVSALQGSVDVYIAPGASGQPNTSSGDLVTPNGIAFGAATVYRVEAPGPYTVTVVSALDTTVLVLNQVVTLQSGKAATLYVLNGQQSTVTTDGP